MQCKLELQRQHVRHTFMSMGLAVTIGQKVLRYLQSMYVLWSCSWVVAQMLSGYLSLIIMSPGFPSPYQYAVCLRPEESRIPGKLSSSCLLPAS